MRRLRSLFGLPQRGTLRTLTAVVTLAQLLVVATAPLAERADTSVAAVHMEQAGTSRHHAHGDFCAVCTASHLTALPPRPPASFGHALVMVSPLATEAKLPARGDARPVSARAPPV
jgi:hypothetical protein